MFRSFFSSKGRTNEDNKKVERVVEEDKVEYAPIKQNIGNNDGKICKIIKQEGFNESFETDTFDYIEELPDNKCKGVKYNHEGEDEIAKNCRELIFHDKKAYCDFKRRVINQSSNELSREIYEDCRKEMEKIDRTIYSGNRIENIEKKIQNMEELKKNEICNSERNKPELKIKIEEYKKNLSDAVENHKKYTIPLPPNFST